MSAQSYPAYGTALAALTGPHIFSIDPVNILERISKSPHEDNRAGELQSYIGALNSLSDYEPGSHKAQRRDRYKMIFQKLLDMRNQATGATPNSPMSLDSGSITPV